MAHPGKGVGPPWYFFWFFWQQSQSSSNSQEPARSIGIRWSWTRQISLLGTGKDLIKGQINPGPSQGSAAQLDKVWWNARILFLCPYQKSHICFMSPWALISPFFFFFVRTQDLRPQEDSDYQSYCPTVTPNVSGSEKFQSLKLRQDKYLFQLWTFL